MIYGTGLRANRWWEKLNLWHTVDWRCGGGWETTTVEGRWTDLFVAWENQRIASGKKDSRAHLFNTYGLCTFIKKEVKGIYTKALLGVEWKCNACSLFLGLTCDSSTIYKAEPLYLPAASWSIYDSYYVAVAPCLRVNQKAIMYGEYI